MLIYYLNKYSLCTNIFKIQNLTFKKIRIDAKSINNLHP